MHIRCCRHTCAAVTFFLHCIFYCVQVCHASDLWPYSALVVDAFEKRSPSEVQVLCLLNHAHCDGNQFLRQVRLRYACFVSAPFPHFNLFCNLHASGICALFSLYDPFHLFMLQCGCLPNGTIALSFRAYNIPVELLPTGSRAVQQKMMISTPVCKKADLAFSPVAQHLVHVPSLSMSSKHNFSCG